MATVRETYEAYLASNPDVKNHPYFGQSWITAREHWERHGKGEGRGYDKPDLDRLTTVSLSRPGGGKAVNVVVPRELAKVVQGQYYSPHLAVMIEQYKRGMQQLSAPRGGWSGGEGGGDGGPAGFQARGGGAGGPDPGYKGASPYQPGAARVGGGAPSAGLMSGFSDQFSQLLGDLGAAAKGFVKWGGPLIPASGLWGATNEVMGNRTARNSREMLGRQAMGDLGVGYGPSIESFLDDDDDDYGGLLGGDDRTSSPGGMGGL